MLMEYRIRTLFVGCVPSKRLSKGNHIHLRAKINAVCQNPEF